MDRPTITTACVVCGRVFEARRTTAMYCSETCRKRRQRMNGLEPIMPTEAPIIRSNATTDDVAAAIVAARTTSNTFAQLGKAAPPPLRAGCERIAAKIEGAIREEGW